MKPLCIILIAIVNARYVMFISPFAAVRLYLNHPGWADLSNQSPPFTRVLQVPLNSLLNLVMPAIGLPNASGYYLSCVL